MDVSKELLFFFSALGAFNGVILAIYLLFIARPKRLSNLFLGGMLLSMSIRIGKSVFYYFMRDLDYDYLQLGLTGCFFIGPFFYFYTHSIKADNRFYQYWKYHLLLLVLIAVGGGYFYPYEENISLWKNHVISFIYHFWLGYLLLSGIIGRDMLKNVAFRRLSSGSMDKWWSSLFIGNIVIWAAYYFAGFTSYILA